jgi:hypothetical protein
MTPKRLVRVLFTLLLALFLLPPGAGMAENAPHITLHTPGEGSRLISPIPILAEIQPDAGGLIRIELLDKQGKAIARQLLRLEAMEIGQPIPFKADLPFEIPSDEEQALLTLSLLDAFYRPVSLRSAHVNLLSRGGADVKPTQPADSWVTIDQPKPMDIFTGGSLTVSGAVTPLTENPILIELIADDGRVIGTGQVRVHSLGQTVYFETELFYYYIQTFTDARLVVRQSDDAYNTTIILDSILIGVAP